jgi:prolyl oligopeptidase
MRTVTSPPFTVVEPVTEILHGVAITDPYRWLEDQNSPRTRAWIEEQTRYARAYLDGIPGRNQIHERVRELLDVETYDSFLKSGSRYFFRKRKPGQQQPSIYLREGPHGKDQLLVDPLTRSTGDYTAVKPRHVSLDGNLLLYEVKQGGERMGTYEILDIANRRTLPDSLPHGHLRGFTFAPDGKSFYYAHESADSANPFRRVALHHTLGSKPETDQEVFYAGEDEKTRLVLIAGAETLGFLVYRFSQRTYTDFYILGMGKADRVTPILRGAEYCFIPRLLPQRILAEIDENTPNRRIVEVQPRNNENPLYLDMVPTTDAVIRNWIVTQNHIAVSYLRRTRSQIVVFDQSGNRLREISCDEGYTVRIVAGSQDSDEIILERESFTCPVEIIRCALTSTAISTWAQRAVPFCQSLYRHIEVGFSSNDGMPVPMFLLGHWQTLSAGSHPLIMTSYGGYGISSTPQFSAFVAFLIERGCLFALPNIRGGSEFGAGWHESAKRRNRQVAFDDFISAAEWLIRTGRTGTNRLAIFGGSNSGLLVGVALTQRPDLFRAAVGIVPMLDMLRYHLFDNARVWSQELGIADDPADFSALLAYSPYHAVCDGAAYPAVMIVSGDADQNCNPLHARKMAARLQAANSSSNPILLDYSEQRGHSPVLPLRHRIDALTDRLAFLCDQLGLSIDAEKDVPSCGF